MSYIAVHFLSLKAAVFSKPKGCLFMGYCMYVCMYIPTGISATDHNRAM